MESRFLGNSSLQISKVGLGCNNFGGRLDQDGTRAVIHKALDLGITFFDTADSYGGMGASEEAMGKILGEHRKDIVLASKFGWPLDKEKKLSGASRTYIMSAVEASLKRLRTDWIDLYQMHVPDPRTPIEETLRALDDLVRQGKVRHVGCSNLSAQEVDAARRASRANNLPVFLSTQAQYNLLDREVEKELIPALQRHDMGLLPFSPLAGGLLTGKYHADAPLPADARLVKSQNTKFLNDANLRVVEKLRTFCQKNGHSMIELALGWLYAQPAVSCVFAGAMTPQQLEQNVRDSGWKPSVAELAEIDKLLGAA